MGKVKYLFLFYWRFVGNYRLLIEGEMVFFREEGSNLIFVGF